MVGFFGALDEGVEFDEGVGGVGGGEVLGGVVGLRDVERILVRGSRGLRRERGGWGREIADKRTVVNSSARSER